MAETYGEAVRRKRLKFREILARPTLTVMPGGFGPVYARVAEAAGFECFFVAGSQVSGHLLGVPDSGIMGLRDIADHARHVAAHTDIPILLDTDTGFGNVVNVHFTVKEVIRTGVAGLQIEDQEAPKKSGTLPGRRCIPMEDAVVKSRAAVAARDETDPDFVICARCDILGAEGGTFDQAMERSVAYVEDGGVDFVWLNSVETREQIAAAAETIPAPLLIIWGGGDPMPSSEEYEKLGARIVLYPTLASSVGLQAAWHALHDLKERGTDALVDIAARARSCPYGRAELRRIVGFERIQEIEDAFLPQSQRRNYKDTWGHVGMLARKGGPPAPGEEEG
ncbi:MAG: isocitrate lyase/phosphoenolpyruvate mutase family protein [Alphaproteobacteria bacterium]|nr:isocitrate lyase/phosphoenolpyruvate mutase family protein [Alphaproteobacteria bacterium]